jgi:hypothetical protein
LGKDTEKKAYSNGYAKKNRNKAEIKGDFTDFLCNFAAVVLILITNII